jgi:hypothetical protein
MAAAAVEAAGCMCGVPWSIFATDVGSFEETARGLSGSGGIFLVTAQARRAGGATREH